MSICRPSTLPQLLLRRRTAADRQRPRAAYDLGLHLVRTFGIVIWLDLGAIRFAGRSVLGSLFCRLRPHLPGKQSTRIREDGGTHRTAHNERHDALI